MGNFRYHCALGGLLALAITVLAAVDWQPSQVIAARPSATGKSVLGQPPDITNVRRVNAYAKLPLSFEVNQGQTDGRVKFLSRGPGYTLYLTSTEAVLALRKSTAGKQRGIPARGKKTKPGNGNTNSPTILRMTLVGAKPAPRVTGLGQLPGKSNYLLGNDRKKWRTNVPHYAKVHYDEIYADIDVVYYGNQQQIEYDFVVAPGGDPGLIRLSFEGAEKLNLDSHGNLVLHTPDGPITQRSPVIYQYVGETKRIVAGGYVLRGHNEVGFDVEAYDLGRPLIIDPVLVYSTFLGPAYAVAIAVDTAGNAYVWGNTGLTDPLFPTTPGAFRTSIDSSCGGEDAFVSKLSSDGSTLVYSTYLGGSGFDSTGDYGNGIAVDRFGNAHVTGRTASPDFPTTAGAFQPAPTFERHPGGCSTTGVDAFVTKLDATGSALVYSTFLGGAHEARGIAVDSDGDAYITGATGSANFPTLNAFQPALRGSHYAFVTKLNASGTALVYSTYLGGNDEHNQDEGTGIAVDAAGNAYITGQTGSTDFPTTPGAFDTTCGTDGACDGGYGDGFVTKIGPTGALVYSSFLGGSNEEVGHAIALDGGGNVYVTGPTHSLDFPTTVGSYDTGCGTDGACNRDPYYEYTYPDGFVAKLAADGSALVYGTFLGGSEYDEPRSIAVDASGNTYVAGFTFSADFPTANPFQPAKAGYHGNDAFVARLSSTGSQLLYSTYLGGSSLSGDWAQGLALDPIGNAYVVGSTLSGDFPTINGLSLFPYPQQSAFIVKLDFASAGPTTNVVVHPISREDWGWFGTNVTLTFDSVAQFGKSYLTESSSGPVPPQGFSLGDPANYYELTTAVVFSGTVKVCINYTGTSFVDEASLKLFHFEGGIWVDRTVSLDTASHIICASVTSLSPFAILEPVVQPAGLQPPLAALVPEGDSVPLPDKAFKRGSTLPMKLQVFRGGVLLSDLDVSPPQIVALLREGDAINLDTVDLGTGQANDSGLFFRFTDGSWLYNLSSKGLDSGTYVITIQLSDGHRYVASFVLK